MLNFSELHHRDPIREQSAIYTATVSGRIGFIDADDIATTAASVLVAPSVENTDCILTGPEAISYDVVAATLSEQFGRPVEHKKLTVDELAERHENMGLPAEYASTLAAMDAVIAEGSEDRVTDHV